MSGSAQINPFPLPGGFSPVACRVGGFTFKEKRKMAKKKILTGEQFLKDFSKKIVERNEGPDGEVYRQGAIDLAAWLLNGGTIDDMSFLIQTGELPHTLTLTR
jgi:hypothetical protein